MSSITLQNGSLVYQTPYNPALVMALKTTIPDTDRRWDPTRKVWIVDPRHGQQLVDITQRYLGEQLAAPTVGAGAATRETRILEVRYIGTTKDQGGDDRSAYGYVRGAWSVILPEKALRDWFAADSKPEEAPTLYAVLGVGRAAGEAEIKSAYRRLARQWHPDVARSEPNAAQVFMSIHHAYEVLSSPNTRARYDAGLALEASLKSQPRRFRKAEGLNGYRSPLRCGLLLAEGIDKLGRFFVDRILAWTDIEDGQGRVLVTTWPMGAERPVEQWV